MGGRMPSWKLHEKWAVKFGISQEIAKKVNKLIDLEEEHDLGLKKRKRLAGILPYDEYTVQELVKELYRRFREKAFEASLAALLHHYLDTIEKILRNFYPLDIEGLVEVIVKDVESILREHGLDLLNIYFRGCWESVCNFCRENIFEILKDIEKELIEKGKVKEIGDLKVLHLFAEWRRIKRYPE